MVANNYRVDGVLGRGGMGVVVSATDIDLDRNDGSRIVRVASEQAPPPR